MPGSGIREKCAEWPLNEDGSQDVKGLGDFLSETIKHYGGDYAKFLEKVDHQRLDAALQRLGQHGINGLQADDFEHVFNAVMLTLAVDAIHEANACKTMLETAVKLRAERSN